MNVRVRVCVRNRVCTCDCVFGREREKEGKERVVSKAAGSVV